MKLALTALAIYFAIAWSASTVLAALPGRVTE